MLFIIITNKVVIKNLDSNSSGIEFTALIIATKDLIASWIGHALPLTVKCHMPFMLSPVLLECSLTCLQFRGFNPEALDSFLK